MAMMNDQAPSSPNTDASYPRRDIDNLYCQSLTYLCAIGALPRSNNSSGEADEQDSTSTAAAAAGTAATTAGPCVPCAYKICNFDVCLDAEFTKRIPNQRPERCHRSRFSSYAARGQSNTKDDGGGDTVSRWGTMGYHRGMNVLTVGDGDFSFSLAVSRLVLGDSKSNGFGHTTTKGGMVVATSYENSNTLRNVYPDFDMTLDTLTCHGDNSVIVAYNVDATRLDETLPEQFRQNSNKYNEVVKFHRICWNFPCTAIECGQDGQNNAMEQNKELCRKFVVNALPYLDANCGEIHMAHKTKPPYNQWLLEKVVSEGTTHAKEFEFKGRIVFDRCTLSPYTPRKALDRKSFPCHDACIYVFGWRNNSNDDQGINLSTLKEIPKPMSENDTASLSPSSIVVVTANMVNKIRSIHLEHLKRKHDETNFASKKKHGTRNKRRKKD